MRLDFLPAPDERELLHAEIAWTKRFLRSRWMIAFVAFQALYYPVLAWLGGVIARSLLVMYLLYPIFFSLVWLGVLFAVFRARVLLRFRGGAARDLTLAPIRMHELFPALLVAPTAILLASTILPQISMLITLVSPHVRVGIRLVAGDPTLDLNSTPLFGPGISMVTSMFLGMSSRFLLGFACMCFAAWACANGGRSAEAIVRWVSACFVIAVASWLRSKLDIQLYLFFRDPAPELTVGSFRPSDLLFLIARSPVFHSLVVVALATWIAILALRSLQSERFRLRLAEYAARA